MGIMFAGCSSLLKDKIKKQNKYLLVY